MIDAATSKACSKCKHIKSVQDFPIDRSMKSGLYCQWNNYGKWGWHIDHIKPLSLFDLTKASERKQALHFTNLQPLWWSENVSKNNRRIG